MESIVLNVINIKEAVHEVADFAQQVIRLAVVFNCHELMYVYHLLMLVSQRVMLTINTFTGSNHFLE